MKKNISKVTALILAITMLLSFAVSANAQSVDTAQSIDTQTANYLLNCSTPTVGSVGGEWIVLGLARDEKISNDFTKGYYENVQQYVSDIGSAKLHSSKSTDNSRVIIALTSIGKDVTNVSGYNLLEPLSDLTYVKKQGINGPIWALLAFDTLNYEIPVAQEGATQTTRENLVDYILEKQIADGGWALFGTTADVDVSAMAIQALAPYYNKNEKVKTAVDNAVNVLSNMQSNDGGFASWGTVNSESCAQVIVALTSLGINPQTDERFIKNGNTVIDAICNFYVDGGGFMHIENSSLNQMATEQAYYAIVSYLRLLDGKTSLYNMSDTVKNVPKDIDGDGYADIKDCSVIQLYLVGECEFTEQQQNDADYDNNGVVDISDVSGMQLYFVEN